MSARRVASYIAGRLGVERSHVAAARMYGERHLLASVGPRPRRAGGRILAYHTVGQTDWGVNDVTPRRFRRQLELALKLGYRFVAPSQIALTGGGPKDLAVSFDDGMKSVFTTAAPILREYGAPFAFFPVTDWAEGRNDYVAGKVMSWDEMGELVAQGAEIGSHSVTHPDFGKLEPQAATEELTRSRAVMTERLGFAPEAFAIPFGQSMNWSEHAAGAARAAGYSVIYAQAEETRPPDTAPRTFVTKYDGDRIFRALLQGRYDRWEEWF